MQSVRKYLISLVSVVYALILLHNVTPHAHGALKDADSFGLLTEWFHLLFGNEHHEYQEDEHLTNFRIQEDNEQESALEFSLISDYFLLPSFFVPFTKFKATDFAALQLSVFPGINRENQSAVYLAHTCGPAPPFMFI